MTQRAFLKKSLLKKQFDVSSDCVEEKKGVLGKWHTAEDSVAAEGTFLARCTRRLAQTVARNVRFPSNQQKVDRFTAESASRSTDQREEAHRAGR